MSEWHSRGKGFDPPRLHQKRRGWTRISRPAPSFLVYVVILCRLLAPGEGLTAGWRGDLSPGFVAVGVLGVVVRVGRLDELAICPVGRGQIREIVYLRPK